MTKAVLYLIVGLLLSAPVSTTSASAAPPNASVLLRNENFRELDRYYSFVQHEFRDDKISAKVVRDAFRAFYPTDRDLAAKYDAWVKRYPKSYVARLARAIYYKKIAYEERGDKFISETSDTQLARMDETMKKAIGDFGASIEMDPKPFLSYFHMLDISSSYAGAHYTRKMYDEAIRLAPMFVDTRRKYMLSLEDKWGGSLQQMQYFLTECEHEKIPRPQLNALESMVYENEAVEREQAGDHAGAALSYRKSIDLGGAECDTCLALSLSKVLVEENKVTDAIPFLSRYIADHPSDNSTIAWRASLYLKIRKVPEAVADLTKAATAGLPEVQNQLGVLYMTGVPDLMPIDAQKGLDWLRKAAAQGNTQAQHNLPMAEKFAADINKGDSNKAESNVHPNAAP